MGFNSGFKGLIFIVPLRGQQFLLLIKGAINPNYANFLLVPKVRMSGAEPTLPRHVFMTWLGTRLLSPLHM